MDYNFKVNFKNVIINLMNIDTSIQLKQNENVVIPAIETGFMGKNYYITSEIVFLSLYKVVRIISDQDVTSENTLGERVYNKLVIINYNYGFSVTKTIELPKDIFSYQYELPLYYDGAEAKFVVISAAKQFFIYDLLAGKYLIRRIVFILAEIYRKVL